jgi:flavin reductase (DIM6/NTAB) family NADH-FMN oxidoreductase RutF
MRYDANFDRLCGALEGGGAFLVVEDRMGRVNVMTIGWAQAGFAWGRPVLSVLVRPSRHTHALLAKADGFSVCVPRPGEMKDALAFCGSRSGRDYDKARACALKLGEGARERIKYIEGCELVYQCVLSGTAELKRETLQADISERYYPGQEAPHTLYFGSIIKAERFK